MSSEPHSMLTAFCVGLCLATLSGNAYMAIPTALAIYVGPDLLVSGAGSLLTIARLRLCPPPKPKTRKKMTPPVIQMSSLKAEKLASEPREVSEETDTL